VKTLHKCMKKVFKICKEKREAQLTGTLN
jgi:hypothetical protein